MLRSTGFFRGLDCPFYAEYSEEKGIKNGCNRPYCHFRHSSQRRASYGAPADVKKQRDLHSAQKEQGYDPFNPEVVRPQEQKNGEPAPSGDLDGALDLVNKAIEEVRSEVEREKRKLSRIGDEPPKYSTSTSSPKCKYTLDNLKPTTDMEYDPMSNYSSGIAAKSKRPEKTQAVKMGQRKTHKQSEMSDEEYVVAVKKPRPSIDSKKYIISDSDEESSGTEYRPTSLSNVQQRKGNSGGPGLEDEVDDVEIDFSSFQEDLDFDSDPMEECLRIFNESKDVKTEDKGRQAKQPSRDSDEEGDTESTLTTLIPGQKKRVSHFGAKTDAPVARPNKRLSAQAVCYQRMQMAQQQAAQLSASVKASRQSSSPSVSGEKKRIAHRTFPPTTSSKTSPADVRPAASRVLSPSQTHQVKPQTTAGILTKTTSTIMQKRVAHTPTMKSSSMKRPIIPIEFGAKVPNNVRQRYLNTFIDECVKFCRSKDAAFQMALDEEKLVYDRSNSKSIYLNIAVNTLKKLRGKSSSGPSPAVTKNPGSVNSRRVLSHEELLGGRLAAKTSFTVNRMGKQQEEKLIGVTLYRKLQAYLMSEEQFQENGYPRTSPEASGKAIICNLPEKKAVTDPFNKICCRCGAEYKINVNGNCVRKEECCFHWGRLRRHKVSGGWETNYSCCAAGVGAPGCQVCKQHVQDGRKESFDGYVTTFSKSLPPDGNGGVFALDCEMCYTRHGLDLTRVTVIDSEMKVIYDTFVRPEAKVVDYNTRFSGVTEEDLENATITLRDVQAVLLSMFSAESILIGHSLESDLLALKLIHSTVVDTAIVFPHRLGAPYKRALRNLMADHLKRIIQDNVNGHDSSEDASACLELMLWRIKEDAKVKR
ncbi:RNA exonuclease 1 like [Dissostichus eleginoides]|uniref:RNA exonuclease 1 like n=1 Tax=Dissostichus eleginoides TaxID=100907 RepID=A0AAD9C744_DISEL|nr:RNA exonuclease 1 like [Dissostichus eleginoides]